MNKPDLCMFCARDESRGPTNREHFVARCFWSEKRPSQMKPVPAHVKCNKDAAPDSEYLRDVLVAEEGNLHAEAQRLRDGELKRKMHKRFGAILKTLKNVSLRWVAPRGSLVLQRAPVFELDRPRMDRALGNVVKGCFYLINGRPVPQTCTLSVVHGPDIRRLDFKHILDHLGPINHFGDDVFLCRTVSDATGGDHFGCLMRFYRYREFLGIVRPPTPNSKRDL